MNPAICSEVCHSKDRPKWLDARRTGIGSSDAPAILGVSPFSTPLKVAASKQGLLPETEEHASELLRWGHYVEGPMIEAFNEEERGRYRASLSGWMFRSLENPFLLATLDGTVVDGNTNETGTVECKLKIFGADEWEEGVPEHVQIQQQHGMAVTGAPFSIALGLLDGYRLRWKRIERNEDLIQDVLLPEERAFWKDVQDGRPISAGKGKPSINADVLKRLHPKDDGTMKDLGVDDYEAFAEWLVAKEERKRWEQAEGHFKNLLVAAIGESTFGLLPGGQTLSLRTTERKGYEVAPTSYRMLRVLKSRL